MNIVESASAMLRPRPGECACRGRLMSLPWDPEAAVHSYCACMGFSAETLPAVQRLYAENNTKLDWCWAW